MSTNLIAVTKEAIWYVIDNQLCSFDFQNRIEKVDANFTELGGLSIRCLLVVDGYQKPWCGTSNGIFYWKNEKWLKLIADGTSPGGFFRCLAFDGKHVLAAANLGLSFLDFGEYFSWRVRYDMQADGLPSNRVNCLLIDNGRVFCGTEKGLAIQESDRFSNFVTDATTTANILDLAIGPTEKVWFIEQTSLRKRNKAGIWETIVGWAVDLPAETRLQCLHVDGHGVVYLGTEQGLVAYRNAQWQRIDGDFSADIRCLYGDTEGTVWCLTARELLCLENSEALALGELPDLAVLLSDRQARHRQAKPIMDVEDVTALEGRDATRLPAGRDDTVLDFENNKTPQPVVHETPKKFISAQGATSKLSSSVVLTVERTSAKAKGKSQATYRIGIARTNFSADVQWSLNGLPERAVYGCAKMTNKLTLSVDVSQVDLKNLRSRTFPLQLIGEAPGVTIAPINLELQIEKSLPYWVLPTLGFVGVGAVVILATGLAPVKMVMPPWSAEETVSHAAEGGVDLRVMVPEDAKPGQGKLEIYKSDTASESFTYVDAISDVQSAGLFIYTKNLPEGKYRFLITLTGYRPLEKIITKESSMVTKADSDTGVGGPALSLERKFLGVL